ncbi:MAG: hypothetical protein ACYDAL_14120 [Candidatus Dormibacteraceae bacterium]
MKDPGRIRIGALVYFGVDGIPCHVVDMPASDLLAANIWNADSTKVVLAPIDGNRSADVPTAAVPYADEPAAGAWRWNK